MMRCPLLLFLVFLMLGCATNQRHAVEADGGAWSPERLTTSGKAIADMQAQRYAATYGPPRSEDPADIAAWLRQIDYMRKAGP
jgi:hypothetical protein